MVGLVVASFHRSQNAESEEYKGLLSLGFYFVVFGLFFFEFLLLLYALKCLPYPDHSFVLRNVFFLLLI